MNQKKNIIIQCLATLTIISGLIAFRRINKTKAGIVSYLISFIAFISINIYPFIYSEMILGDINKVNLPEMEVTVLIAVISSYIISLILPIIIIYKLTKDYNKQILV